MKNIGGLIYCSVRAQVTEKKAGQPTDSPAHREKSIRQEERINCPHIYSSYVGKSYQVYARRQQEKEAYRELK